jgi:lysine 2,3-aminomutase
MSFWEHIPEDTFENSLWQHKNAITHVSQLQSILDGIAAPDVLSDIEAGIRMVGMSIRLTPYVMSLIDWGEAAADPIRRQFLSDALRA